MQKTVPLPACRPSGAPSRRAGAVAMLIAASLLTACASEDRIVGPRAENDYTKVHPIVLAEGQQTLDIFVIGGTGMIGERQLGDLRAYATEYRRAGLGPISIAIPDNDPAARRAAGSIRQSLQRAGARTVVSHYAPTVPDAPAPIRLSFPRIKADVATQCGRWPSDLSGAASTDGWQNTTYENFGCATQSYIAAQVADPLDLARPRPASPANGTRMTGVTTLYTTGDPTQARSAEQAQTVNQSVQQ